MQLHELQPKTKRQTRKRVGRGQSSGRGKTAGRGTKGQRARAGHRIMPAIREQLKKLPKRRGYNFKSIQTSASVINVGTLEHYFAAGDTVAPSVLVERGLVRKGTPVKILGEGAITKKLTITGCAVSASARTKIEAVGGTLA